jgi:hypothetical protein
MSEGGIGPARYRTNTHRRPPFACGGRRRGTAGTGIAPPALISPRESHRTSGLGADGVSAAVNAGAGRTGAGVRVYTGKKKMASC